MDIVSKVIAWENGEMNEDEEAAFFQELLDSGAIYHLQGTYQRTAQALIDAGVITPPEDED